MKKKHHSDTVVTHAGRVPEEYFGFVNPPVYQGSTILYPNTESFMKRQARYPYGRRGSPTMEALENALSELEGAAGTVLEPSGLAAISVALLSALSSGDHLLMTDTAYQPTRHFCDTFLTRMGVEITYYDPLVGGGIAGLMKPNTKVVFTESPGSLTFEVQDVPAIAAAAHAGGAVVILDNTWATPLLFRALDFGVDITVSAATKYIVGHSDAMLGTVSANEKCWKQLRATHDALGMCAGPDVIYLGQRGLRTMAVRLRHHDEAALKVARWLAGRPEVDRVLHPALEGTPGHDIWKRDFKGASGLFSVIMKPGPQEAVAALIDGLELFGLGASWGGYESLVIPFDPRPVRTATKWDAAGPGIRLHIGLESVDDLIADLEAGMTRWREAGGQS